MNSILCICSLSSLDLGCLLITSRDFGALDKLFEVIILIQTQKLEAFPIICPGSACWESLHAVFTLLTEGIVSNPTF